MLSVTLEADASGVVNDTSYSVQLTGEDERAIEVSVESRTSVVHDEYNFTVNLSASNRTTGNMTLDLQLAGQNNATVINESVTGDGVYQGQLNYESTGAYEYSLQVSFQGEYNYTATPMNETAFNLSLYSHTVLVFPDYASAMQAYYMLNQIVQMLNLTQYVTITPPPFLGTTVEVTVHYNGIFQLNNTAPETPWNWQMPFTPGQGLPMGGALGNITFLAPLTGEDGFTLEFNSSLSAVIANSTLKANASYSAEAVNCTLDNNFSLALEGDAYLDRENNSVVVEVYFGVECPSGPFMGFAIMKSVLENLTNSSDVSVDAVLEGTDGVSFIFNGDEVSTVEVTDDTNITGLAVKYAGTVYYGLDGPTHIINKTALLPPLIPSIIVENVTGFTGGLPFPAATVEGAPLHLEFPDYGSISVMPGSSITGALQAQFQPADQGLIPSNMSATPIGPMVTVRNVTGTLALNIVVSTDFTGEPALLVIHENGSVTVVTNVTISGNTLTAVVPAQSTFIPVALTAGGGGGGGETTTTTTTTPSQTTTETTTTTPKTTTPGTTLAPGNTTTTMTTTSPTGTTASTTTSTTTTQPTQTGGNTSTTTTTSGGGKGISGKTAAAAGAVVVIVIIAAAAYLLTRK
ncbi:MAG: hypothetical protein F7C35_06140 [Desulfurococcales archaeon]|nr:hypothetical protein [Desulfurococcales archaeon]